MPDKRRTFIPTPPAQLDELAKITAADIDAAVRQWQKDAPAPLKGLLDATPADGTVPVTPAPAPVKPPKGGTP